MIGKRISCSCFPVVFRYKCWVWHRMTRVLTTRTSRITRLPKGKFWYVMVNTAAGVPETENNLPSVVAKGVRQSDTILAAFNYKQTTLIFLVGKQNGQIYLDSRFRLKWSFSDRVYKLGLHNKNSPYGVSNFIAFKILTVSGEWRLWEPKTVRFTTISDSIQIDSGVGRCASSIDSGIGIKALLLQTIILRKKPTTTKIVRMVETLGFDFMQKVG